MAELTHFYDDENTLGTRDANTYSNTAEGGSNPAQILGSSLSANTKYLIVARALLGADFAAQVLGVRVSTADDSNIATKSEALIEFETTGDSGLMSYLFAHSFTTDASPADVEIQIKGFAALNGVKIDQSSLFLLDLDAIGTEGTDYFEDINAAGSEIADDGATPPADWTDLATLTAANLGTDTYLILGSCSIGIGSAGRFFRVEARGADDAASIATLSVHQAEGEDTSELRNAGFAFRHHATTQTDVIIRAQEEAANGNMIDKGSYLIALPESLFADTLTFDYTAGAVVIDGTETTIATTGSYTPTVTGNHLIFGRSNGTDTPTALGGMWVESTTTEIRTGDSTPTHNQIWDSAKDNEQQVTFQRYSITTAETFNLRSQGAGAAFDQEHRWLIVVNLNPPAVAADVYPPWPRRQNTLVRM